MDLAELQMRVDAAKEQYGGKTDPQGKLILRLKDLAIIVEGSLAKQRKALELSEIQRHKLQADNEQLRGMVISLLNVIENRSLENLQEVMHRLDRSVSQMIASDPPRALAPFPAREDEEAEFLESGRGVISLRR